MFLEEINVSGLFKKYHNIISTRNSKVSFMTIMFIYIYCNVIEKQSLPKQCHNRWAMVVFNTQCLPHIYLLRCDTSFETESGRHLKGNLLGLTCDNLPDNSPINSMHTPFESQNGCVNTSPDSSWMDPFQPDNSV